MKGLSTSVGEFRVSSVDNRVPQGWGGGGCLFLCFFVLIEMKFT